MYPHVKLFHLINSTKDNKSVLSMLNKHKDDEVFKQLVEIMCSPDYIFTYIEEPSYFIEKTVDTKSTINEFILLTSKAQATGKFDELTAYINSLDSISRYVYLHVIRGNDLGMAFTTVATTLNLYMRRSYAEIPRVYGFPTFPFYAHLLESDVDYFDVHFNRGTVNVTFRDGRKVTSFDNDIYKELLHLNLEGVLKGYVSNHKYIVTNFYTSNNYGIFTERLSMVEVELYRINALNVEINKLVEVKDVYDLEHVTNSDMNVICIPDEEQKLEGDHNIFILQGHRLTSLIEERKKSDTWKR